MLYQQGDSLSVSRRRMTFCRSKRHLFLFVFAVDNRVVPVIDNVFSIKVYQQEDLVLNGGEQVVRADKLEYLGFP
jgi:hypothetical protein